MNGRPILGAALITLLALGQPVLAATEISGNINNDTVWTKENGPYQVTSLTNIGTEEAQASLTIEQGTVVEFSDDARINVFGDLVVNGTEVEPVTFGAAPGSSAHNWQTLVLGSTGSTIQHLNAHDANYGLLLLDSTVSLSNLNFNNADILSDNSHVSIGQLGMDSGSLLSFGGQLSLMGASINNVDVGFAFIGDADSMNITGMTVANSNQGLNIVGNATLNNINTSNTNGLALSLGPGSVSVANSNFNGGNSVGISISNGALVQMNDVNVTNFMAPGIAVNDSTVTGTGINASNNLIGIANYNGTISLERSALKGNTIAGLDHSGEGAVRVANSSIGESGIAGVMGNGAEAVDARGNYWGHPGGPTVDPMNPDAVQLGDGVFGNVIYEPWLSQYCEADCHSNIMFLPGIMSSRLYKDGEQLWEPGTFTSDDEFLPLYLDENGQSIDPEIYTDDVLDNGYAYGKLIEDLTALKAVGTINDYEAVPYDWRLSMEDVLNTGVEREDGTVIYGTATTSPYIENSLRRLAANSKSGKVTIVAHSNGGLVTKALINKLGSEAAGLIDKIIFVGVPQVGTPQAIGSLLHGYNAGLPEIYPFVLSPERSRDLALNMPMIYQLMPFSDYYNGEGASVGTPYVTFEDGAATQAFIDRYGYAITPDELEDFLNGAEGRGPVAYEDLGNAARANATLLAEALATQAEIDSTWNVPEGIEMHQIAGTGEETLTGITYKTIKKCNDRNVFFICESYEDVLSYTPNLDIDGDGTVVVPSALAMSEAEAERWWLDLQGYNGATPSFFREKHANILEVDELRNFIINRLISETTDDIPNFISNSLPILEEGDRLTFTLHSPLSLSAIDDNGNVVSPDTNTIPGASYQRFGEIQVITMPAGTKFAIVLDGEADGSFTLEMEEWEGGELNATSTLSAIPSGTSTVATISFTEGSLETMSILEVDYNGDRVVDLIYTPEIGESVSTPNIPTGDDVSTSGGRRIQRGQVLGVSTDLSETLRQVQIILDILTKLKGHIPDEDYSKIEDRVRDILRTALINSEYNEGV